MKKILSIAFGIVLMININAKADEGMWLLSLMNKSYSEMKAQGFQLTAEDIYSVNQSCLKDAIAGLSNDDRPFGFFCSGEIISDQGLMLTNHHCGFGNIQAHSSPENDYLKDGFWAMSKEEELINEGLCVSILQRMEDVTDKVLADVTADMSEKDRDEAIRKAAEAIEAESVKDTHYAASVKNMFEGNKFYLFIYETYKDIRLVGAPPSAIGKFGGDTDNWMWPRHTGDFSMFRIYMGKDGKPATPSKENVPYKPKHHLPVSVKGVEKDDFAMVMGFPGTTERYLSSYGIEEALEISNPSAVKIRTKKLELMKEDMNSSDKIRIQYAAKYAQTANYWKYYQGQSKGLKKLKVYDQKKALEDEFQAWADADTSRKAKYGDALSLIEKKYMNKEKSLALQYLFEGMFSGGEITMFAYNAMGLYGQLKAEEKDQEGIDAAIASIKTAAEEHFKDYNVGTDKKIFKALTEMFYNDVPKEYHIDIFTTIEKKYKGDFQKFTDDMFAKSVFASKEKLDAFLAKPSVKVLEKDLAFKTMKSVLNLYFQSGESEDFHKGRRLFIAGLIEMKQDKNFYPDANSTIRCTYGQVGDYEPMDAVYYNYFTTIDGIMEKEDPSVDEFVVPAKLKELYKAKDFGQYADKDGNLHVCFTTNNDITGGNSGSGVINGNGELIGTAFDGNWEAMSGDIAFEKNLQKCINVDIRYTLFIIDKFAGAKHLVDEMTIVRETIPEVKVETTVVE